MSTVDANEPLVQAILKESKLTHTGGVHGLFVDGSVRFLSMNMDAKVRRALLTIAGNEDAGDF
jgi:prepilin-type processing-associated H-X9-DG protein